MRTAPPRRRCSRARGAPSGWARSPPGMPPSRTCARSPRRSRSSPARPSAASPRAATPRAPILRARSRTAWRAREPRRGRASPRATCCSGRCAPICSLAASSPRSTRWIPRACACSRRPSQAAARRRAHVSDGRRGAPRALAPENARGPHGGRDVLGKGAGVHNGIERLATTWQSLPDYARSTAWILVITVALIISVALLTLWERKVIGWMQLRRGPNRVRLFGVAPGLGQPFADVLKLLLKAVVVPANSDNFLFRLAPVLALVPALAAWAVIPLSPEVVVSKADAGLLYLLSLTSMGVYGVIVAGWAANSKYAFLGAMRSAAQMVAYEVAMGFALVGVLMATGSMNLGTIVRTQEGGGLSWNWFWLFPLLMVYFISGVAETNRAPFDVAEGESEIVAGFHVEYSGIAFALFFLAEYMNMILIAALCAVMFLGGWLSPLPILNDGPLAPVLGDGLLWLFAKMAAILFI